MNDDDQRSGLVLTEADAASVNRPVERLGAGLVLVRLDEEAWAFATAAHGNDADREYSLPFMIHSLLTAVGVPAGRPHAATVFFDYCDDGYQSAVVLNPDDTVTPFSSDPDSDGTAINAALRRSGLTLPAGTDPEGETEAIGLRP